MVFLSFTPLFSAAQKFKNVEIDSTSEQPILKVDRHWVQQLNGFDNSQDPYDGELSENVYQKRFALLDAHTDLNIDYNPVTFKYVQKYLSYSWYRKVIGISVYYFPLFEAIFEKYGIPKELKYLAILESALNPRAISSAGAKGLWQIMPQTGAEFNPD